MMKARQESLLRVIIHAELANKIWQRKDWLSMILNEQDIINLVNSNYCDAIIGKNKFGNLIVGKENQKHCEFSFRKIGKQAMAADKFLDHLCLSFGYRDGNSGQSYLEVADCYDLSQEIIEWIDRHLQLSKNKFEQLKLF